MKRTVRDDDSAGGSFVNDHPDREPVAFPEDAVILGRVVWTARALV